jgi:hypothetical protein
MKKIFLLSIIFVTVISVNAQTFRTSSENQLYKNSLSTSSVSTTDNFIDNLSVYPNPVVDILKISFKSGQKSKAVILLFNNIGKQVFTQESDVVPGSNLFSIDVRNKSIEPGIYFVQIVVENEVLTRKLIVK